MTASEQKFSPEVQTQIDQLKALMVSGDESPENLRSAWKTYLGIKRSTVTMKPLDRIELGHVETTVEALDRGGVHELNSTHSAAIFDLKMDTLGVMGTNGRLWGPLESTDTDRAKSFMGKMSQVLLRSNQ